MADSGKKRTRNSVPRSLMLPREQDERLNKLCDAVGLNRNRLVTLVAARMTPADVRELQSRSS